MPNRNQTLWRREQARLRSRLQAIQNKQHRRFEALIGPTMIVGKRERFETLIGPTPDIGRPSSPTKATSPVSSPKSPVATKAPSGISTAGSIRSPGAIPEITPGAVQQNIVAPTTHPSSSAGGITAPATQPNLSQEMIATLTSISQTLGTLTGQLLNLSPNLPPVQATGYGGSSTNITTPVSTTQTGYTPSSTQTTVSSTSGGGITTSTTGFTPSSTNTTVTGPVTTTTTGYNPGGQGLPPGVTVTGYGFDATTGQWQASLSNGATVSIQSYMQGIGIPNPGGNAAPGTAAPTLAGISQFLNQFSTSNILGSANVPPTGVTINNVPGQNIPTNAQGTPITPSITPTGGSQPYGQSPQVVTPQTGWTQGPYQAGGPPPGSGQPPEYSGGGATLQPNPNQPGQYEYVPNQITQLTPGNWYLGGTGFPTNPPAGSTTTTAAPTTSAASRAPTISAPTSLPPVHLPITTPNLPSPTPQPTRPRGGSEARDKGRQRGQTENSTRIEARAGPVAKILREINRNLEDKAQASTPNRITASLTALHQRLNPHFYQRFHAGLLDDRSTKIKLDGVYLDFKSTTNKWRVDEKEADHIVDDLNSGKVTLRLAHSREPDRVIGRYLSATVKQNNKYCPPDHPDGKHIDFIAEVDPQDPQVRTNILNGYITDISPGLDAEIFCANCSEQWGVDEEKHIVRACKHDDSEGVLRNIDAKEGSMVVEPAYEGRTPFRPSFSAAMDVAFSKRRNAVKNPFRTASENLLFDINSRWTS